jgi:hypothetical protein
MAADATALGNRPAVCEYGGRVCRLAVTAEAIDFGVLPAQLKTGSRMHKAGEPLQVLKRSFCMALGAIPREALLVGIFMAAGAIGKLQPGKFLEFLPVARGFGMALPAIDLEVGPVQGKIGLVMVKARGRPERLHIVTLQAIFREGFLVEIFVAAQAALLKAQESLRAVSQLAVGNVLRDMALPAIHTGVFPLKLIAGEQVVKSVLVKPHHFEIPAVVVAVAFGTVFPHHLRIGVVPVLFIDQGLYFGMAGQAFLVGHLFPQFMALGAIADPFQFGMGSRQISRGNLAHRRGHSQQECREEICEPGLQIMCATCAILKHGQIVW